MLEARTDISTVSSLLLMTATEGVAFGMSDEPRETDDTRFHHADRNPRRITSTAWELW